LILCPEVCPEIGDAELTSYLSFFNCSLVDLGDGCVRYTPVPGFELVGEDTVEMVFCNDAGECQTITFVIAVGDCDANTDPEANIDLIDACLGETITIDVLANDTDIDGDNLTICLQDGDAAATKGAVVLNDNGTMTYTANLMGGDEFSYTICDGAGGMSQTNVFITIENCNTNPDANGDTFNCEDGLTVLNVMANDIDEDGDAVSICLQAGDGQATHGTVSLNDNGTFSYVAGDSFDGDDSFTYTICDGNGGSDQTTVIISCPQGESDCNNDIFGLCGMPIVPVEICVEFCNPDAVLNDLTTTFECSLLDLGDNCFRYIALPGFLGEETIVVEGCDADGNCEDTEVNITIVEDCDDAGKTDDEGSILNSFEITNAYPVPANDFITFDFSNEVPADASIKVYDINGRMLKDVSAEAGYGSRSIQIDLYDLSAGTYFLSVETEGRVINSRFLKN